jgi:hypothetical protein
MRSFEAVQQSLSTSQINTWEEGFVTCSLKGKFCEGEVTANYEIENSESFFRNLEF